MRHVAGERVWHGEGAWYGKEATAWRGVERTHLSEHEGVDVVDAAVHRLADVTEVDEDDTLRALAHHLVRVRVRVRSG